MTALAPVVAFVLPCRGHKKITPVPFDEAVVIRWGGQLMLVKAAGVLLGVEAWRLDKRGGPLDKLGARGEAMLCRNLVLE